MKPSHKNSIIAMMTAILVTCVLLDCATAQTCWQNGGVCQRRRCFPRIRVSGGGCPENASRCCKSPFGFVNGPVDIEIPIGG
ncbi:hypothetical protein Ocin01_13713 [Orchesella cincta]|uniref:Beta-defensin-like domain-containing protein n=1 Tax=Orchesella cincta TaxID=48709 RepID=A0A1D2MIX6_ORCCI|nr:hypothetical protein Ocin01_13713 [Orchesella cincta]